MTNTRHDPTDPFPASLAARVAVALATALSVLATLTPPPASAADAAPTTAPADPAARLRALSAAAADHPAAAEDRAAARQLARQWLALCDDATAAGDYATAATAAARCAAAAEVAQEYLLGRKAADRSERLVDVLEQTRWAKAARQKLTAQADDPDANLTVGRYLCAVKGDWTAGLAALARGADPQLKVAAEAESAGPASAEDWTTLADRWLAAAGTPVGAGDEAKPGEDDNADAPGKRLPSGAASRDAFRRRAARAFQAALALAAPDAKPALLKRLRGLPGTLAAGAPAGPDFAALTPIAHQPKLLKTPSLGNLNGTYFADLPGRDGPPALLVGFRYVLAERWNHPYVASLRPIYLTAAGRAPGRKLHGTVTGKEQTVEAADGYAVGGLVVRSAATLEAMKVVFMRIRGVDLDPDDAYESDWFGGTGGNLNAIGNDGNAVLGLHGRAAGDLNAIGLLMAP